MPIQKNSGFFFTPDQLYRKFYDAETLSADFVARSLTTIRDNLFVLPVDYSKFSSHVFFDSAERKTLGALKKIIDEYPIGLSGTPTDSLSARNTVEVDNFIFGLNGYEKFVLSYLGGVTGNSYLFPNPSLTASSVTEDGTTVSLIALGRDSSNGLTGAQATLSASLLSLAQSYDSGINTVQLISGTASDFDITYFDDGSYFTSRILPSTSLEYINRQSNMFEWMPSALSNDDTEENLKRFMSVVGGIFDEVKLYVDQFANLTKISYDDFNRVPDGEIQKLLAKHFGYELIDTLFRQDISEYLRKVGNQKPLYVIASKIWNRVLNNLIYLYKKKGTLESIKALSRIYGLPDGYLSIDDYSFNPEPTTQNKIEYKNVWVLNQPSTKDFQIQFSTSAFQIPINNNYTFETRVKSDNVTSVGSSGYIFEIDHGSSQSSLFFDGQSMIWVQGGDGVTTSCRTAVSSSASLRNALSTNWVNVFGIRRSSQTECWTTWIDESSGSAIYNFLSGSASASTLPLTAVNNVVLLGQSGVLTNSFIGSIHEFKFFKNVALHPEDIFEHTQNYESVSLMNSNTDSYNTVVGNWKLKENAIVTGGTSNYIVNSWTLSSSVTGQMIPSSISSNRYTLEENMRKETSFTNIGEFVDDNVDVYIGNQKTKKSNNLSIGFKPVNAVNTDIINMFGDLNVSSVIGDPINFLTTFSTGYAYGYPTESISAQMIFRRYAGSEINLNGYIDVLESLAPIIEGITKGIDQLVPARTNILNRGVLIESHLLESSRFHTDPPAFQSETVYTDTIYQPHTEEMSEQSLNTEAFTFDVTTSGSTVGTSDFSNLSTELISSKSFVTSYRTVGAETINPFYQQVNEPSDTQLLVSLNRNYLKNSSSFSDWTTSITGVVQLSRRSSGKIITSEEECIRIEVPFSSSGSPVSATEHWFNIYVDGVLLDDTKSTFDFTIPSKTGVEITLTRKSKFLNQRIGILDLRITNLLSGSTNKLPVIVTPDETGFGGTLQLITQLNV